MANKLSLKSDGELPDTETEVTLEEVLGEETHKTKNDIIEEQLRIAAAMRTARGFAVSSTIMVCGVLAVFALLLATIPFLIVMSQQFDVTGRIIAAFVLGVMTTLSVAGMWGVGVENYEERYKFMLDEEMKKLK